MAEPLVAAEAAIYSSAPWWVAAVFFAVLVGAAELGYRLRPMVRRRKEDADDAERDIMVAALGLLALMLAFTFAMAHERYDQRRQLVAAEAGAVEAVWLQSELVRQPERTEIAATLRQYVDARISYFGSDGSAASIAAYDERSRALLHNVWRLTRRAILSGTESERIDDLATPVSDMARALTERRAARNARVPFVVLAALGLSSAVAATLLGYVLSGRNARHRTTSMMLFALVTLAIYLTLDFDDPINGLVKLDPQPFLDLRADMERSPLPQDRPGELAFSR